MSTPTLTVRNIGRSHIYPWRIGLLHADGHFQAIAHLTFPLRREAVPVLRALEALDVDWSADPATWRPEVWEAVCALQAASPGWQVHQRGLAAWEERPATPGADHA